MSIRFNADEILQMAIEVERNGARFYHRAAERARGGESREVLAQLAAMEEEHEGVFTQMRTGLSEEERRPITFDPDDEAALYLKAMADRQVFDVTADPTRELTGKEPMEEVLRVGIQAEKDSILFYLGLKEVVPPRLGQDKVEAIIKEEMGHVATLSGMLAELLA